MAEITEVVAGFASAAVLVREAVFDGVEAGCGGVRDGGDCGCEHPPDQDYHCHLFPPLVTPALPVRCPAHDILSIVRHRGLQSKFGVMNNGRLRQDYGMTLSQAAQVMGTAVRYSVPNLAGRTLVSLPGSIKRFCPLPNSGTDLLPTYYCRPSRALMRGSHIACHSAFRRAAQQVFC